MDLMSRFLPLQKEWFYKTLYVHGNVAMLSEVEILVYEASISRKTDGRL